MKTSTTTPQTQAPVLAARLNSRERKAQRLLAHYATCERLARYLAPCQKHAHPDGKKISVALWKAEQLGQKRAERMCSDSSYTEVAQTMDRVKVKEIVRQALGTLPPGFFVNSDPRGYSCKIDNENPDGAKLIEACGLHRDMGSDGILSPEINGDR